MKQHPNEYVKNLINRRKLVDPSYTVQKLADDTNIAKSTIDKFLAGQTSTSFENIVLMVESLGGSLDELAGLSHSTASTDDTINALVDSYKGEVERNALSNVQLLDRFRRVHEESRELLIEQNRQTVEALQNHIASAICSRNAWRMLAIAFAALIVFLSFYTIYELSHINTGVTGLVLRNLGILP